MEIQPHTDESPEKWRQETLGVSHNLGFISKIMLWIDEWHLTRWDGKNGLKEGHYYYLIDLNSDQKEFLFDENQEPLFFECPERWRWHYVLTSFGETMASQYKERGKTERRITSIKEETKAGTQWAFDYSWGGGDNNIVPFPMSS